MLVHGMWLKSLLGPSNQEAVSFAALCTEHAMAEAKRWFDQAATSASGQWRETHLLDFLRRCTDLCDAQVPERTRMRACTHSSDAALPSATPRY
jgi:hypothetical protein